MERHAMTRRPFNALCFVSTGPTMHSDDVKDGEV